MISFGLFRDRRFTMKVLVAIANYGSKNQAYLERLVNEYKSMSYDIDIVVLSNIPKELSPDIEVRVGLPAKNPWSLPFRHKELFAERIDEYDLFIYSEDDTLIKQENIEAFVRVQEILSENEIAGFLRYEEDTEGKKYCSSIHSHFHWILGSVKSIGKYTFAHFTNAHSACYILTQEQLQKAIESGGYLVGPHEGRYDLLCTAATDPYTQCGFRKMMCISHIGDFLLHHLPNQYIGRMGLELSEMQAQINALLAINGNKKAQVELFPTRTMLSKSTWDKLYYEQCRDDILAVVPHHSRNVLSVGCGWGATEAKLVQRGVRVVGIPLDSVIAESAKSRGIEILSPNFNRAKESLTNEKFDCILLTDVLQHLRNPGEILTEYAKQLDEQGYVIITVPNFNYIKHFYGIATNGKAFKNGKIFDKTQIHFTTLKIVAGWLNQSELKIVEVKYRINDRFRRLARISFGLLNGYLAPEILFVTKKA